jgi:hypothetical protein
MEKYAVFINENIIEIIYGLDKTSNSKVSLYRGKEVLVRTYKQSYDFSHRHFGLEPDDFSYIKRPLIHFVPIEIMKKFKSEHKLLFGLRIIIDLNKSEEEINYTILSLIDTIKKELEIKIEQHWIYYSDYSNTPDPVLLAISYEYKHNICSLINQEGFYNVTIEMYIDNYDLIKYNERKSELINDIRKVNFGFSNLNILDSIQKSGIRGQELMECFSVIEKEKDQMNNLINKK